MTRQQRRALDREDVKLGQQIVKGTFVAPRWSRTAKGRADEHAARVNGMVETLKKVRKAMRK